MPIVLPIEPPKTTNQMKRVHVIKGKPVFFPNKAILRSKAIINLALRNHVPSRPMELEAELDLVLIWPYRKTEPKRKTQDGNLLPHNQKPDADNAAKMIIDCLTDSGFVQDDKQIADLRIRKFWGPEGLIIFDLKPIAIPQTQDVYQAINHHFATRAF